MFQTMTCMWCRIIEISHVIRYTNLVFKIPEFHPEKYLFHICFHSQKKASSSPEWFHPLQICWWRSLNPFDIRTRSCQDPPPGLATIAQSHGCLRNRPLSLSKQGDVDSIKSLPNVNWKTNTNLYKSLLDGEQIILNTVDVHMNMSQTEDACDVRDIP